MALDRPVIAIVGAGAVGGYYGTRLAQHGHDVHFLLRSDFDAVRTGGWTIRSRDGDFVLRPGNVHAYNDAQTMPAADLVIITLKATANDRYETLIRPLLKDDTTLLTLQNGLGNEERLAELFGDQRIVGGLAFVCINRTAPGVIEHTDYGLIALGEFAGSPSPRTARLAEILTASRIPCKILPDLRHGRWEKLLWNIPFNGLGAVLDMTTDQLIGNPVGTELVRSVMQEVIAAAQAVGVRLGPELIEQKLQQTRTMGAYRSSMQIDRQQRRPMEIEAIVGNPLRAAQSAGIAVPRLEMLYRTLRLIDDAFAAGGGR